MPIKKRHFQKKAEITNLSHLPAHQQHLGLARD